MSAEATITVECVPCGMKVSVPNDAVGEMYAIDFDQRHGDHECHQGSEGQES